MKKGKGNSRRRILSWILAVAVLAAGIPVQAAAFEAVPFADDIFSAGEAGDVFTDTEINVTPSPTETQPEVPVTPSPGETPEPGVTPGPSEPRNPA